MANKQLVIEIISDAKKFVNGIEEGLKQIESASKKAEGFDKITEEAAALKEQISNITENLQLMESATRADTTAVDAQIEVLQRNVNNLDKKFDSFRHTFKDLQDTVKSLNTDYLNSQMEKMASNMKEVTSQYLLLRKESESFLTNKNNINDITNIDQLKKAFNEAKFLFENFNNSNKKNLKGDFTKEYQEAASALFKYAEALIQVDRAYADSHNGKSLLLDDQLNSLTRISDETSKIVGSQASQIRNTIETIFSSIDVESFFQKQITGKIENGAKGFLVKGAIEIPVKLKENAKLNISAEVKKIIDDAQKQINDNPIEFNFEPIEEKDNKLLQTINSYFDDISKRLQEQAQELNNVMGKILNETGIKDTQQNFEGVSTSIVQLLANLKDFAKEITSIETANERFNTSFSSENLNMYVKTLEEISDSFKKLISAIDNVSTKLNKNGLESQFDIIKNKFSTKIDLGLSAQDTKGKEKKEIQLIKEKRKELRELFSLYTTYQARGGIRPITDLLVGETEEEKIKYFNGEYKKYIRRNKKAKEKNNKTDLETDIFIPSGILETDKEQLNEILSLLKDINKVLQDIGKTGINTSNNLKSLKINDVNGKSDSPKIQETRSSKQKPIIPPKNENGQGQQSIQKEQQIQKEQTAQELVNTNQKVVESNKELAKSAEEAAQAIQKEKTTTRELTEEEKEKKINGLMYHLGNLNDPSKRLSHPFGDEIKSWFTGIKDSGRGWGDGTGLYTTKDINAFSKKSLSEKSLERFYAIDTSDLNLYEAHAEETAKEFNDFIHHLEQFCIAMGSSFEGFDSNLEGINEESLYSTAQKLFPNFNNIFKDFDSFYDWVNQMITLVSKSGIKADGTINSMQMFNFKKEYGTDDIKTRFLKQLGYQGTDLSGTSFGGTQSGNVIFDILDTKRIVASGKQIDEVSQRAKNTIIDIKKEIKETSKAENELGKEVENVAKNLENQNKEIKESSSDIITTTQPATTAIKKPAAIEKQIPIKENNIQEQVEQTENNIENSEQNILNLVNNIKESLDGLRRDLKILAEMIVVVQGAAEQKDYVGQIETIKNGIIALNVLILELSNNIKSIDFGKISKLELPSDPFENVVNSLKEIIDLIERISGQASKTNLNSQFEYIQSLYNSMVNKKGNFVARGNKNKMQQMYSLYDEYKNAGGQKALHELTDSKSNQDKIDRHYGYYQSKLNSNNSNQNSTKNKESVEELKTENETLKESVKILTEVINNKQKLSDTNRSVAESTKSNAKEIENENQKIKESNNQVENKTNKRSKKKKEQYSPNFTMVGEPYGEEIVNKNLQKNTSIVPTNGFTMVDDGYMEDVEHTQVRVQEAVKETTKQIEQQKTELETAPNIEVFEGEVIGAEKELTKIYQQELDEFKKGFKSYEEAYRSMEEKFAEWCETQGYNHTKSIFNVTPDFQLKSATITRENPEDKNIITDSFKRITNKETGESKIIQTNIQLIDNEQKRVSSFTKELERNQREREKLQQWIASFNNKTSDNFKQANQMLELNQLANDASLINEKSLQRAETLKTQLETVYNDVVNNARRGSSSLSPIPNMMFGEESTLTKLEKAKSIYSKMAVTWNKEDDSKRLKNTEKELQLLADAYKELEEAVKRYDTIDENGNRLGNVVEVSNAYGNFNEQLNKVTQQLNRIKIINTEINGNKINNLNNWFKDIPDPEKAQGKIERYGQIYNQFVEGQQRLNELTTNLTKGNNEESAQKYKKTKEDIHNTILELEELKKILSSDSMNINNQMGQVIKQNLPETTDIDQLNKVIDEYADARGKIQESSRTGLITDKEGNQFIKFSRTIQNTKGIVSEFEFTYDKAMGTVAVATKKIQEPENIFKALADELTTKWKGLFTTLASFVGFYRLWGYFKQGITTVREFDSALTEMQKVSEETISTLQQYQKTTFDTADAVGATALQIQNSTADFMRLGESLKEAAESAKVANILMNVSEFESINEATKSLIAMSAAYDNLSKMNIIDKLNEVGNNYAISTSEAATALQNSASALKTAGNDMDESLALITAGNAVVQDASKVGTGMRTIALRLTGTKSAKEALEELGEDTDSMLVTQSKLRDTIKEATAVASNNFKGFDILDDNGNYKSTYEIMLGIAEVYNEILETDKQLGRNNANLLLESVAGKVRANIAASIFQNPELLKEAYKSSQEAENSAMEENEKYMNSINGHIAQLQNAYQQLWANSMNRDTVNYFIDLGKAILKVVDDVGLLGTAFVAITGIKSIVGYQNGKGFAYELIKGSKKVIENLAKQEGALGSLASTAVSAGQAMKGAFSSAIPIIGGVATAIGLVAVGINAFIQHQKRMRKELIDSANTMGNDWKEQRTSLSDYASQYEELKKKLTSENLSEQETLEIKQQIYDIQKQITEQYGHNADGIDLINGKLQDQLDLINSISQAEASRIWESEKYQKGFELAKKAMTTEEDYSLNMNLDPYNYKTIEDKELSYIIQKYTQERKYGRDSGAIGNYRVISGNPKDADERVLEMIDQIEKLQAQYSDNEDFKNRAERILSDLRTTRDKIEDIRKDNESTYLEGLPIELMATKGTRGYKIYSDYQSSVSNLEDAYISGDTKKIEEARKALEEATIAKDNFLNIPSNNQFSLLFDNIDTSLIKTKNQIYDATEAVKQAKEINTELDRINNYKEQKKQANAFYNSLGNVQKVGNIDNGNRPIIFWDNKELKKQQKAIESWGETIEDFQGSMSTVYGGSGNFDGVEIAFTPIINDGTGKGKLLNKETLYKYIDTLIGNAGEGWTNESLLKLDAEGLVVDGQKISNVLGAVGNSMSNVGLTAVQVGELMHDWQSGSLGYISEFKNEWQEAIEQGESLEEHMRNRERDLLDTSKATDKYTKKEIKLAKALREVTRLDMDRVDAEMVFDENAKSSEAYSNALYNLMDALGWASDAHASFIDWAVDVGLIQGTVTDALDAASVSYNDYAQAVSTATENLALLQTVLTESDSGKGLSTTTLDQFKTAFGDDAVLALEKTANGIRVNRDAIRELGAQQDESLRTTQLQALNDQYTALQKVYEGYEDALHNGDPTTPFIQQEEAIRNEINNLELLQAEWRGTTSAYQAWLNAQSNSNPQDMYANVISGYETVEDLIARGWWTDESVRNYLDLVLADDFDAQIAGANELKEGFESLDKTIQGTSFSIHDFFMTDESGNIVVDGLNNFEDALKQVQEKYYPDKNWLTYEDGNAIFDFRNGGNKEVADALGIGTELLDIIISAMESAGGFEVKLDTDDAKENLKQLKEEAIDAKESLDLNEKINLDPSNIKEADESINNINTVIEEIKNNDEIDLEAKTDQLEEANKILEYLIENKNQLIQSSFGEEGIHLIDIGELDAVNNKLKEILNRPVKGGFDFSEFDFDTVEGLTAAQDAINNMVATPNVDDSQIQYLNELLDVITEKLGIINGIGSGASLTLGEYKALDETVTSVKQQIQEGQDAAANGFHISWSSDEDFYNTLDAINNLDPEIKTAFGLIPDKTTEELMDMVENGETIFVETKTTGVTPAPVQDETRTINTQENITLGVTTVGADTARSLIQEFEEKNGTESTMTLNATSNVSETKQEIEETQQASNELGESQPDVTATLNDKATSPLLALGNLADSIDGKSATIWSFYKDPNDAQGKIRYIAEHVYDRKQTITTEYKTTGSPPKGGTGTINGTAHAQGTAFARGSIVSGNAFTGGKWGIPQNQTALTGELGTEIVVRDGNWFTVGEDGAEFVNLQKGDIVFNHKQAQELLENGYVTSNKGRGKLVGFANGSAFYRGTMLSGPAYGGDSAKRQRTTSSVATKQAGKKNTKKTTTGKGNGGGGGKGNGGGSGGTTNKEANKTKNTLDEVEILIARIERQIVNLDKTISSTYKTWSTRNNAIKSDLAKVAQEIKDQNKAYTTYIKKANSVGLPAAWKKKVQSGKFKIEDVTDDKLWQKIQDYQTYYNKALQSKDAIIDLKEKEGELYKQRFDNEQTYYEELIGDLEHAGNLLESYNDKLSESGKLGSQLLIRNQIANEKENIRLLNKEYDALIARRNEAVNSGKIKKYSEAWYEMTAAIQEVSESIAEAQNNVITLGNNIRQLDWDRWDKIHDAIAGVNNELEFLYDLFNSDDFFDEQGNLTDQGVAGFALLAQQYDTYFRQVQEYQKEIEATEKALKNDPNNQNLVDKLKELKEAQQDAVSGAKDTKEAMVDLTEDGIKKQIDYVKDLIEDYEDLLETQKDQIDYAKKIADQQKELNKLEKQYRAIQNDTSEEGAAKRQKLRDQINEKRDELQESQDDRRLSETKDMLSDFEESFETFQPCEEASFLTSQ